MTISEVSNGVSTSSLGRGVYSDESKKTNETDDEEARKNDARNRRMMGEPDGGTRFGGLAATVERSVSASIDKHLGSLTAPFPVTPVELGILSNERTRSALADLLEIGVQRVGGQKQEVPTDVEAPDADVTLQNDVRQLVINMRKGGSEETDAEGETEADRYADVAANVVTSAFLRSSPESGIDPREVEHRREVFGTNAITTKKLDSFLKLCAEAIQDFVLIMLIVLGSISIVVEVSTHVGDCTTCWIEGAAILVSVCIVVMVTAGIDYAKQFAFQRLTRSLHDTNTKQVIRDAKQVSVIDDDIVVGDILSVNAHNLASIPADCILLGPASDLKMNESSLTGESKLISKRPGDIILSGTNVAQGSGKMVVIAVGVNSVSGKIKARVYESEDHDDGLEGEDSNSPLFVKLETIAKRIGICGTVAATLAFLVSCIVGFAVKREPADQLIEYLITAITVLAVAVPEGLPLAVTLALAFSSNKMMKAQNLVKHLDACETMGCATTICTDKTGTLTANKMTARAIYTGATNYVVSDPSQSLGDYVKATGIANELVTFIANCVAINTMNETVLYYKDGKSGRDVSTPVEGGSGNPTEIALLTLIHDLGYSYQQIRNSTKGRSDQGAIGKFLSLGKQFEFTSSRKMMSWAVPKEEGGYRLYCKGASEVVLSRCDLFLGKNGSAESMSVDNLKDAHDTAFTYARRGMRCLALAYRDVPKGFSLDTLDTSIKNSDGTQAYEIETGLTCIALVGIEDPLRKEVPGAIEQCYRAGIDVRMVTGDNPNTAVSIAFQAGILREFHFVAGSTEFVADNLKPNVLMEGKVFRSMVYTIGKDGTSEFDQAAFDKIWPHLRVLARSSPDDKLTLAHGLNQSSLYADKEFCAKILREHNIKIFPDRQVVAMTGDGTNDAPALKRADIGFAMGISGTQIAKDAADIILLDDNFASIVTAAKWGRNIYASIQKFLQFQLNVNIVAVTSALVGAFYYQKSPLAAIQLLWVNLLMDSLASLALASEPPVDALLHKPPVNRTDSMLTKHMWANLAGHSTYQIIVVMTLLFKGVDLFDSIGGVHGDTEDNSVHYTFIFNTFVWMQLFNEVNCRKLKGERNVFSGILNNYIFVGILLITAGLQAIIVEFGSIAFHVHEDGLPADLWGWSLLLGSGELLVQQVINVIYRLSQKYKINRNKKRSQKNHHLITQRTNGATH